MAAVEKSKKVVPARNALRRIFRDLKELKNAPLENASLAPPENADDVFELHGNVIVPHGPYKNLLVHFIIYLNEYFPVSSPSGKMPDGFPFTSKHHEHIYDQMGICNDYLSNFESFFKEGDGGNMKAGTGWSPGITLKNLLMVMGPFFADIDYPEPSESTVKEVFEKVALFRCSKCHHTEKTPYPPLGASSSSVTATSTEDVIQKSQNRVRELLVCSTSKENFLDNPSLNMGYPIDLRVDSRKRLWTTLIPELISYDQYAVQIQQKGTEKLDKFNRIKLRTANGEDFTHWLSIYINDAHYNKNLQCIKNTISVMSNGVAGKKSNDFEPSMVIRVLPCLMNKMIVAMMKQELYESESAIYAYCHFLGLFLKLLEHYPFLRTQIDRKIKKFVECPMERNKDVVPDLGEFIILLAISEKYSYFDKTVQIPVMEEYFARHIFWIEKKYNGPQIHSESDVSVRMGKYFVSQEVSLKWLVFVLEAANWFIFPGVKKRLEQNYGLPPEPVVKGFQGVIKNIKAINHFETFLQATKFDKIASSLEKLADEYDKAIKTSLKKGYTKK